MATLKGAELKEACMARMNADALKDADDYDFEIRRLALNVRVSVPNTTPQKYVDIPLSMHDMATKDGLSAEGVSALEAWVKGQISTGGAAVK